MTGDDTVVDRSRVAALDILDTHQPPTAVFNASPGCGWRKTTVCQAEKKRNKVATTVCQTTPFSKQQPETDHFQMDYGMDFF